jgi:predicted transcriptional regulator
MRKRESYTSITFKPSPEMRKKIIELANETEHPASTIVYRCLEYALRKVELKPVKKDIDFPE